MGDDLAAANVNRSYQLAASSIAIFTFLLFFLYPRFANGQVDALRFQATLIVMGVATFSFAFASFYYYAASLGSRIDHPERAKYSRRGDRLWLLGCVLLFLAPSLILFTVRLLAVASVFRPTPQGESMAALKKSSRRESSKWSPKTSWQVSRRASRAARIRTRLPSSRSSRVPARRRCISRWVRRSRPPRRTRTPRPPAARSTRAGRTRCRRTRSR